MNAKTKATLTNKILSIASRKPGNSYQEILKQLLQDEGWSEKFSELFLKEELSKTIRNLIDITSDLEKQQVVDSFLNIFAAYARTQVVYMPLAGITLGVDSLEMGRIRLINLSENKAGQLYREISQIISQTTAPTHLKRTLKKWHRENINRHLLGRTIARVEIVGDPDRAKERCEEECRRVIDLFRFAIPYLYSKDSRIEIGLQGEAIGGQRIVPIVAADFTNTTLGWELVGPIQPFQITHENIKRMRKMGLLEVAKVLEKSDKEQGEFERLLLRNLHWVAEAQIQKSAENKFLNLIISLETVLTPNGGAPIGASIAEGVAFLLSNELEERKTIKKRIKEFYSKRSAISHGGNKAILKQDLDDLDDYSHRVSIKLIEMKVQLTSHTNLFDWIETQKFR